MHHGIQSSVSWHARAHTKSRGGVGSQSIPNHPLLPYTLKDRDSISQVPTSGSFMWRCAAPFCDDPLLRGGGHCFSGDVSCICICKRAGDFVCVRGRLILRKRYDTDLQMLLWGGQKGQIWNPLEKFYIIKLVSQTSISAPKASKRPLKSRGFQVNFPTILKRHNSKTASGTPKPSLPLELARNFTQIETNKKRQV